MDAFFLGNCQVNAMRGIARDVFPKLKSQFISITPYWANYAEDQTEAALDSAPLVVAQAIENPQARFNVDEIRQRARGRVVFVPYVYLDGFAGLESIASKGRTTLKGEAELKAAAEGRKPIQVFEALVAGRIDLRNRERLDASLDKLAAKERAHCDVVISDFLAEAWPDLPLVYGINHPTQHVLFRLFGRLCQAVDWRPASGWDRNELTWWRRALPPSPRSFSPADVRALDLSYDCDPHWYGQAFALTMMALKVDRKSRAALGDAA